MGFYVDIMLPEICHNYYAVLRTWSRNNSACLQLNH